MTDPLDTILAFLTRIGLAPVPTVLDDSSLLPGVDIKAGQLVFDPSRLRWPGDLLHEAGHIAVMPAAIRPELNGELLDELDIAHAGEIEATAWSYAATLAAGVAPEVLFHAGGYHGRAESLIFTFGLGVYPGVAGLCAAGMAATPAEAPRQGCQPYPHMLKWLRD